MPSSPNCFTHSSPSKWMVTPLCHFAKYQGVVLDSSLFYFHITFNTQGNLIGSTLKIYPDLDHFSLLPLWSLSHRPLSSLARVIKYTPYRSPWFRFCFVSVISTEPSEWSFYIWSQSEHITPLFQCAKDLQRLPFHSE